MNTHESRDSGNGSNIPLQCVIHGEALREVQENSREIRLAVCGDRALGVPGLVQDVAALKEWKRNMELRVAGISGMVAAAIMVGKWLVEKL